MKEDLVQAMVREISVRKDYLEQKTLSTIYFGGGTPSLLTAKELDDIFSGIAKHFTIADDAEITLEANPDDLDQPTVDNLYQAGINRLSIGVQTFDDEMLRYLNRAHTREQAEYAIKSAQDTGIENISLDLMYALPAENHDRLLADISKIKSLGVPHLSAYCLTIEPETAFAKWVQTKKIDPIPDEFAATQFELTIEAFSEAGYEQYEISNFARNEQYSRHNTAYWQRKSYLGIGPSAHSYNTSSREFNVSNNSKYIKAIQEDLSPATREVLTMEDMVNEYLLTGLRTKWGCQVELLQKLSGETFKETHLSTVKELVARGWLQLVDDTLLLTPSGKLFADRVSYELFLG